MEEKVFNLGVGDNRVNNLHVDIYNYIMDKADGLPVASVLGILELIKFEIIAELDE